MTKRAIFLIVLAVGLAGAGLWVRGWFNQPTIQILAQIRPTRNAAPPRPGDVPVDPVTFSFEKKYTLTEVKVVAADDEATNKYPHALWHLISDSNSHPTKILIYGVAPKGMKPKTPRARPDPLEPDVTYHLYVQAGKAKGMKKFHTRESVVVKPNR